MTFQQLHWFLKDLTYIYLDDGYILTATTDVPCHLFKRETTHRPLKHALPSYRRGLALQGDIRFCFTVYEDSEQDEAGDTLTHTFTQSGWPVLQRRWLYFKGNIGGLDSPSESPIFEFVFPAPPPEPPPPIQKLILAESNNRSLRYSWGTWAATHDNLLGDILPFHDPPLSQLSTETTLTASYWIIRTFLRFDTSVLPNTAKLISAKLNLFIKFAQEALPPAQDFICLTQGVHHIPVISADYGGQLPYTTIGGQRSIDSITPGQYEAIDFNSDGLTWINPAWFTKICLRHYLDVIDVAPILSTNTLGCYSEQKGAGYRPYLAIQYYPA